MSPTSSSWDQEVLGSNIPTFQPPHEGPACTHLPGDVGQCDQPACLHGCIQRVCPSGLHGDNRYVLPAHLRQACRYPGQEPATPHRQHHGPRRGSQCCLQLPHQAGVAFPRERGRGGGRSRVREALGPKGSHIHRLPSSPTAKGEETLQYSAFITDFIHLLVLSPTTNLPGLAYHSEPVRLTFCGWTPVSLPLTSYVISGKLLELSCLSSLTCKTVIKHPPLGL